MRSPLRLAFDLFSQMVPKCGRKGCQGSCRSAAQTSLRGRAHADGCAADGQVGAAPGDRGHNVSKKFQAHNGCSMLRPHPTNWGSREDQGDTKHKVGGEPESARGLMGCRLSQVALGPSLIKPSEQRLPAGFAFTQRQGWEGLFDSATRPSLSDPRPLHWSPGDVTEQPLPQRRRGPASLTCSGSLETEQNTSSECRWGKMSAAGSRALSP